MMLRIDLFRGNEKLYDQAVHIMDKRGRCQLQQELHQACYYVNPIILQEQEYDTIR